VQSRGVKNVFVVVDIKFNFVRVWRLIAYFKFGTVVQPVDCGINTSIYCH
jgi:hypothetical protein